MDIAKYNSQIIKDIEHYFTRSKNGNVLKSEQKEITVENKKVNAINMVIQVNKNELLKIEGKNNDYSFTVSLNGNDVYTATKCNSRDENFRTAIKDSNDSANYINCFDDLSKIFKKKRKK